MANTAEKVNLLVALGFNTEDSDRGRLVGDLFDIKHPNDPCLRLRALVQRDRDAIAFFSEYNGTNGVTTILNGLTEPRNIAIDIDTKQSAFFLAVGATVIEQFKALKV